MSGAAGGIGALTVAELGKHLRAKAISPVDLTEAYLQRIEATEEELNAFITLTAEDALAAAKQAEQEIAKGDHKGPLHGIPFATKDLFWTAGVRTTSGSEADLEFVPQEDATVVKRLRDAGAFSIGKTNMSEWAFEITGRNEFFGWACNPWDKERMPGGSSSGSAVVVAAGGAPLSLGTDTGGSIRLPAALCGLSGLKPTYGLVSRHGVTPLSWSLDHAGPLAHTIEDVALVMNVLAGYDPNDPYSANVQLASFTSSLNNSIQGLRIGIPREYILDIIHPEVEASFKHALVTLEGLGAHVEEVSIPELEWAPLVGATITPVEAARYHDKRIRLHGDNYDQAIRRRIEGGFFVPEETYMQAQRVRTLIGRKLAETLREVDVLATPASITPAPRIDSATVAIGKATLPVRAALTRLTQIFNINGLPAASAPCGFSNGGLPMGLQIVGPAFEDATVLRVLHAYQQATDWHQRRPAA